VNPFNPYGWQFHVHDKSQSENLVFLQRLRALLDAYPNTTMVGEIGDDDGLARLAEYTRSGPNGEPRLHMAYCFDFLGENHSAPFLHGVLHRFATEVGDGWPCWALSNHDVVRSASRWGSSAGEHQSALVRLGAAFQASLRGTVCLYQGEELGLPEADIAFEDLQDPYGITMWPEFKGRDGCRTPMPWEASKPDGGFSNGTKPWLPVPANHLELAVDAQQADSASTLAYFTDLLHWRRQQPALVLGSMELLPAHDQVLAYVRHENAQRMLCAFNFSEQAVEWPLPEGWGSARLLTESGLAGATLQGTTLGLAPWGGAFLQA
jgi:alpha-glucosidase